MSTIAAPTAMYVACFGLEFHISAPGFGVIDESLVPSLYSAVEGGGIIVGGMWAGGPAAAVICASSNVTVADPAMPSTFSFFLVWERYERGNCLLSINSVRQAFRIGGLGELEATIDQRAL